jgi:hypothetical protein
MTPTGLLYRPEVVSALIVGRPRESVPTSVLQAIEEQTPIVVMWAIPRGPEGEESPRPFRTFIQSKTTDKNILPLWERQDAADVRLIDPRTPFQSVGTMAAFPREAFRPGGIVTISGVLPDNPVTGAHRRANVYGEFQETRARVK